MATRKTTSVKGEIVDFNLLETKQKIDQNKPRIMDVQKREDFVHRRRRKSRRSSMDNIKDNKNPSSEIKKEETKAKTKNTPKNTNKKRTIVKKDTSKNEENK